MNAANAQQRAFSITYRRRSRAFNDSGDIGTCMWPRCFCKNASFTQCTHERQASIALSGSVPGMIHDA
jgi:hypothetical protein